MSKTPEQEFLESVDQRRGQAWSNDSSAICEVLREYASLQNAELLKELGDLVEWYYSGRIGTYVFTESIERIVQKYTDKK